MVLHFAPTTSVVRVYKDGHNFENRDPWEYSINLTYYDLGRVVYLEALHGQVTPEVKDLLVQAFDAQGVHYARWEHRGKHLCCDIKRGGKLKRE